MKRTTVITLLLLITFLGLLLRFYKLGKVPTSMNADEAAIGYNAYSILKTGKDEYGRSFPLLFQSFDDYKLPLYVYITVPSVAVFGLNDFSVRLPSAVLGTATVFAAFFLVNLLLSSYEVALISCFLLAISPWHLQFSRSAYEANSAVFFLVAGMVFLLKGIRQKKWYIPGFLLLALSIWSYHSSRIFIPLIVGSFSVLYLQEVRKSKLYFSLGLALFVIVCMPLLLLSVSPQGLVRARGVSALDNDELINRNVSWRQLDVEDKIPFSNIYHNQRLVNLSVILKGYLEHYNPNFFFSEIVQGKYHAPGVGLLYLWELPFLLYGLHAMANRKGKGKYVLFMWFILAPVAASPTRNLPHPVRTLIFLPVIEVFVGAGLWEFYTRLNSIKKVYRQVLIGAGLTVVAVSGLYYIHQYYVHGPVDYASDWQYGNEEVVRTVKIMQDKFDKVIVSTSLDVPYMFFLYYLRYDPATYLSYGGTRSGKFDEQKNAFDKYEFHSYMGTEKKINSRTLYVGTVKDVLPGTEKLVEIKDPSGKPTYAIYGAVSKGEWNRAGNAPYLN